MRALARYLPALCGLVLILGMAPVTSADTACGYCGDEIAGPYVEYQGRYYHSDCFSRHIAPRCAVCGEPLEGRWVVLNDKNYHQKCYNDQVALRCSVCGGIIDGHYLIDHWGNKYHEYHRSEIESCSFCGRLLTDPKAGGGHAFDAAHQICNSCSRDGVNDFNTGQALFDRSRAAMAKASIVIEHRPIEFELVDREELSKKSGHLDTDQFGLTLYEKNTSWTLLTEKKFTVFLLKGQPSRHFISVAAHELMHVWLYLNAPDDGDPALVEGSCNYAAYLVLSRLNDEMSGYVIQQLEGDTDPVYGEGFRRVKELVDNRGVAYWLDHLKFDPQFPIGY